MAAQQEAYSIQAIYALGDKYKANISKDKDYQIQWFLAAKLCYLLPTIPGHDANHQQYIDQQKLYDLEQLKEKYNIIILPNSKLRIPNDVLILLKLFYAPWLHEIKQHLKERSSIRINEREKAFMAVFRKFSNQSLDVLRNKSAILQQQHDDIDEWEGPNFQHLIIENKQKGKNKYYLTAVKDYDGYKKRCNNSQEDWSKKYDAVFIANCIDRASQIFGTNIVLKAQFAKELLQETVQFKSSKNTYLVPNSWMFGGKNCVLLTAITDLLGIDEDEFNGLIKCQLECEDDRKQQQNRGDDADHDQYAQNMCNNNDLAPSMSSFTSISTRTNTLNNKDALTELFSFDCLLDIAGHCKNNNPNRLEFCMTMKNTYNVTFGIADKAYDIFIDRKQQIFENVHKIKNLIKNKHQEIFDKINWNEIEIFNKQSNKKRITFCLTKSEFTKELNQFISNLCDNNNNIIPIVMFDDDGIHHIEYMLIATICSICIGISFKYDQQKNMIKPTGIHLNKEFIQQKHQLISSKHDWECLNNLISNVDHLYIGNLKDGNNKLTHYKNRCEELTKFIEDSIEKIQINTTTNMNIKNLEKWIKNANKITTNDHI